MIDAILSFSIRQRWLVIFAALGIAAFGAWNFTRLPIDAVPDITNVQVQINTVARGYSPLEVEQRITFPVETAMGGLPKLDYTRSLSRYGLSQVTVVFNDGTDIYFARQLVNERIQQVRDQLPPGVETAMGPISTGLGEIFMYTVEARDGAKGPDGKDFSPSDLRTIQDWIIKPQLRTVPGIVEVNSTGGYERQFHVLPDPGRLMAYRLGFRDVMTALARVVMSNADGRLRPGLFVTARLVLAKREVPVAVRVEAIQTLENRTVVFVREGDKIEARPVEIGETDSRHAEVKAGLEAGEHYAAENSFVVKAEIGKGEAEHGH
jgi:Cu/Ag efflux pump CusA